MRTSSFLRRSAVAAAALLALSLAACSTGGSGGSSSPSSTSGSPIHLGAYVSASGSLASYGLDEQRGYELAEHDINAAGGIAGHPVDIQILDDGGDPTQARSIVAKLIADDGVLGLLGATTTASALSSQPLAVQANVPVITLVSGDTVVAQGPQIFRGLVPDAALIKPLTDHAVTQFKIKKAAILFAQDDPYGVAGKDAFEAELKALKVKIVAEVGDSSKQTNYDAQIQKLQQSDPDAVFVSAYGNGGPVIKQARQAGLDVPLIGNISFSGAGNAQAAGSDPGTVMFASQWFPGETSASSKAYVKEYKAKYNADPGSFGAYAYNSVYWIKAALEKGKPRLTRAGLLKALTTLTSFDPPLGAKVRLKDRSQLTDEPAFLTYKNGENALFGAGS